MFLCIIHEFSFVFGWISGKIDQMSKNLRKVGGSFAAEKGPLTVVKVHATAWPRRGFFPSLGLRSYCSQRGKIGVFVMFRFSVAPRTHLLDK